MKTKLLIVPFLLLTGVVFGQEKNISDEDKKKAKEVFTELKEIFAAHLISYNKANEKLKSLKENLDGKSDEKVLVNIQKEFDKAKAYKDTLSVRQQLFHNYKGVYIDKGFAETDINNWYTYANEVFDKSKVETAEPKIYTYFGKNQVINHDVFKNKTTESQILKEVLTDKGETSYLGDITIPKDGQKFNFYNYCEKECCTLFEKYREDSLRIKEKTFEFKKLDVEIRDGYFHDIRVFVKTDDGNTHVFTNQVGISLLFYSQYGKRKKLLRYEYSLRENTPEKEYTDDKMTNLYIKVTDVMGYNYKAGNRYIPSDLVLEFPQNDTENQPTNKQNRATYQIKQETNLEKIVELRTYTDFLALFGETGNGLVQIEGKAKFYLFPYPFRFFGSKKTLGQLEYMSSISPYVNYSRFENNNRYASFEKDNTKEIPEYKFSNKLELIEKRFLTMGVSGDVFKWQHKNAPVKISAYGFVDYNITEINIGTDTTKDIKDLKFMGFGGGLHLSTKRFNNFGFDYKVEFSWFDFKNFNSYENIDLGFDIPIFRNEAEVFYHPNGNPNSAIFVRLINYNYRGTTNNQAFYQFQFGYKFAIGNRTVSK